MVGVAKTKKKHRGHKFFPKLQLVVQVLISAVLRGTCIKMFLKVLWLKSKMVNYQKTIKCHFKWHGMFKSLELSRSLAMIGGRGIEVRMSSRMESLVTMGLFRGLGRLLLGVKGFNILGHLTKSKLN